MKKLTPQKVEEKGQSFYAFAKRGIIFGICSIPLAVIIGIVSIATGADFITPFIFDVSEEYYWAYLFVVIDYICILWGLVSIFFYFAGLTFFALGRIAINTEKANSATQTDQKNDNIPQGSAKSFSDSKKTSAQSKKCWACGTLQDASRIFCENCNEKL